MKRIGIALFIGWMTIGTSGALEPILHEPDRFQLELFLDLSQFEGHRTAVQMAIVSGRDDFADGLYFTSGLVSIDGTSVRALYRYELDRAIA